MHLAAARKAMINRQIDEQNSTRELNYEVSFSVYQDGNILKDKKS
jgi:hypothetical protein